MFLVGGWAPRSAVTFAKGPLVGTLFARDVSLAMRLAVVSLAKRGVAADFMGDWGEEGEGVLILSGRTFWWTLFRRDALGPLVIACLRYLVSVSLDVGRSSKPSSSWPSPKFFLFLGRLSLSHVSAATLYRWGLGDRMADLENDREMGRISIAFSES